MIINMSGGGAAPLNFKIVGGTAAPAAPKENTIWVNTNEPITTWALSFDAPAEPVEGTVWITIGTGGYNSFNVLKKNTLAVSPMAAAQFVNGTWQVKEGQIFINGQWNDFVFWLVKAGKTDYYIDAVGKSFSASYPGGWYNGYVDYRDGCIAVYGDVNAHGVSYIADVDLTHFNRLIIKGTFKQYLDQTRCRLAVWSEIGTYIETNMVRYVIFDKESTTLTLNVSDLTGKFVVGISSIGTTEQIITDFYLE